MWSLSGTLFFLPSPCPGAFHLSVSGLSLSPSLPRLPLTTFPAYSCQGGEEPDKGEGAVLEGREPVTSDRASTAPTCPSLAAQGTRSLMGAVIASGLQRRR